MQRAHLPGMTGLDLQDKLASSGATYPIIFMTAHDNPQWQERAKKAGALAYLKKPFDEQALLGAIELACREWD
ncbi:MAG: response regulator [Desulfobacterota bacterium]|nr:response regulator [Thermodesulfobacteriota bacterium]